MLDNFKTTNQFKSNSSQNVVKNGITKIGIDIDESKDSGNDLSYTTDYALTGLALVYIEGIPKPVIEILSKEFSNLGQDVNEKICFMARQSTQPTAIIQDNVYDGMIPKGTPGKLTTETLFSIRFLDTRDLFVTKLFRTWFNLIRPNILQFDGDITSDTEKMIELQDSLIKSKFTANALVFTLDETLTRPTYSSLAVGIWPRQLPQDILNEDIGDYNAYRFNQSFSCFTIVSDSFTDRLAYKAIDRLNDTVIMPTLIS